MGIFKYNHENHDISGALETYQDLGFVVVENVLVDEAVDAIRRSTKTFLGELAEKPEESMHYHGIIEELPLVLELLVNRKVMDLVDAICGNDVTLTRSAAIIRQPDYGGMHWHRDQCAPAYATSQRASLNLGPFVSVWFHLTGLRPNEGGLAVIPRSHQAEYEAPDGFVAAPKLRSFCRPGQVVPSSCMDFSCVEPIECGSNDMVLFAGQLFHAVYPHSGETERVSIGLSFTPSCDENMLPPQTSFAASFVRSQSKEVKKYLSKYPGWDAEWGSRLEIK